MDKPRHTFTKVTQASPPLLSPQHENSAAVIEYREVGSKPSRYSVFSLELVQSIV